MVLSVLLGLSAMGVGILHSSATEASPKLEEQEIRDVIGAQYPGTITELELEKDGSGAVYEAEIDDNGTEYELKLDGDTGEILKLDKKFAAKGSVEQDSGDKESNTKEKQKKTAISRMAMQSPALMITMTTAAKTVRTRMTMKKTAGTAWNSTRIPVTKMIMKQANKMIKRTKTRRFPSDCYQYS